MADISIDKKIVDDCMEFIRNSPEYSTIKILEDRNYFKDATSKREGEWTVSCPFHSDSKPSLGIRESDGAWNCFGCHRNGYALDLLYKIHNEIDGIKVGFYTFLNGLLSRDPIMRATVGSATIFVKESNSLIMKPMERRRFTPNNEQIISTYLQLSKKLKSRKKSIEEFKLAILYMENGLNPQEIWDKLSGETIVRRATKEESLLDISSLIAVGEEDDG